MSEDKPTPPGFKRKVVFRLDLEQWPLMEQAIAAHGSIQAAVLAGLRSLAGPVDAQKDKSARDEVDHAIERASRKEADSQPAAEELEDEENPAREAAQMLCLKTGTVRGYIRSGRLPGRYDGEPNWLGWLTTRRAVSGYRSRP
jgi:hypothetical protein